MVTVFLMLRRRATMALALSCSVLALTGCERAKTLGFETQTIVGSVSTADRCADIMRRAFPGAGFDVTDRRATVDGDNATAIVTATRDAVPPNGPYARDVGAECRFENGILTGFRWTAGPVRSSGAGPTP